MTGAEASLALSVFVACAVEAVEAFTIVLAISQTRRASSALAGSAAALVALALGTAILGQALTSLPIGVLRLVVGGLLLIFGLQWLRKAILRAGGAKDLHDEEALFEEQRAEAALAASAGERLDRYAFAICFKAVGLEGLEVVFIVLTFGANQHDVGLAALAAGAAILLVLAAGLALRAPLARVPENTMKFSVGVLLTAFGAFWGVEGAGAAWPGGADLALPFLVAFIALCALGAVRYVHVLLVPTAPPELELEALPCRDLGARRRRRLVARAGGRRRSRPDRDPRGSGAGRLVACASPRSAASPRVGPPGTSLE